MIFSVVFLFVLLFFQNGETVSPTQLEIYQYITNLQIKYIKDVLEKLTQSEVENKAKNQEIEEMRKDLNHSYLISHLICVLAIGLFSVIYFKKDWIRGNVGGSKTNEDPLVLEDRSTWDVNNHTINTGTASEKNVLYFKDKSKLYICSRVRKYLSTDVEYKEYFITDKTMSIEVIDIYGGSKSVSIKHAYNHDFTEEAMFKMNKDVRKRMMLVIGPLFNFSHALRNSEHVARYIHSGAWISHQMATDGHLRALFQNHMNSNQIKLVNVHPQELMSNEIGSLEVIYPEENDHVTYQQHNLIISEADKEAHNVVILGPTGSGKSALINQIYNAQVVVSKSSPKSVTRKVMYTQGTYEGKKVNIVDTIGMADTVLKPEEVYNIVKDSIEANMVYLDKVVVVCHGRIQKDHIEALKKFMEWLNYDRNQLNFVFIYNKSDDDSEEERTNNLRIMCGDLGVNIDQCAEGSGISVKNALALGLKPGFPHEKVKTELSEFKNAVLSKPRSRILVIFDSETTSSKDQPNCAIL